MARRGRLTKLQRERLTGKSSDPIETVGKRSAKIESIDKQIERLWHIHRSELAWECRGRQFIEDRLRNEWFVDYVERLHVGIQPQADTFAEELDVRALKFGHNTQQDADDDDDVFEGAPARFAVTWAESEKLGQADVVVQEVLAELRAAKDIPASA